MKKTIYIYLYIYLSLHELRTAGPTKLCSAWGYHSTVCINCFHSNGTATSRRKAHTNQGVPASCRNFFFVCFLSHVHRSRCAASQATYMATRVSNERLSGCFHDLTGSACGRADLARGLTIIATRSAPGTGKGANSSTTSPAALWNERSIGRTTIWFARFQPKMCVRHCTQQLTT